VQTQFNIIHAMVNILGGTLAVAISFKVSNKPVLSSIPNHSLWELLGILAPRCSCRLPETLSSNPVILVPFTPKIICSNSLKEVVFIIFSESRRDPRACIIARDHRQIRDEDDFQRGECSRVHDVLNS